MAGSVGTASECADSAGWVSSMKRSPAGYNEVRSGSWPYLSSHLVDGCCRKSNRQDEQKLWRGMPSRDSAGDVGKRYNTPSDFGKNDSGERTQNA